MDDKTFNVNEDKPVYGQRLLVWDSVYKSWTIAYWERDERFVERQNGKARTVACGLLWMPLPPDPKNTL